MKTLTKQEVLNGVRYYFKSILDDNGDKTGCGWSQCALGSLMNFVGTKADIEELLGVDAWEDWPKEGFYRQITDFNDRFVGGGLTTAEVNFFLSSLAAKYNLSYTPLKVYNPVRIERDYEVNWEIG